MNVINTPDPVAAKGAYRPHEILVRTAPGPHLQSDLATELNAQVLDRIDIGRKGLEDPGSLLHLRLPDEADVADTLSRLDADPRVQYATPNHVFTLDEARRPDDLTEELWGLKAIDAPGAWSVTTGSRTGPVIAVLDTGVDPDHPDLAANLWTNPGEIPGNGKDDDGNGVVDDVHGYYPARDSGDIRDGHRHGTHTAGTIGAVGNNGQGVVGINWEARIMPIKIFDDSGKTDAASIIKGVQYADKMGARITSNSWGGTVRNPAIEEAFRNSPALHIAAAGNSRKDTDLTGHYPSAFDIPNMVAVAATDPKDNLASFSNYGATTVDLAAPGVNILSTVPGGKTEQLNGTSMACPHVSGVAALIATAYPQASNEEIKRRLLTGVDRVDGLAGKVATGGRLNAASALENDTVPPGAPTGLSVGKTDSRSLTLKWRASGDDQNRGRAAAYDLRLSEQPILDERSFEQATRVPAGEPGESGSQQSARVDLTPSGFDRTVYVALKAIDNVGQASPM
ncbi:MAG: S8 family serine peptidase, partial [Candidatus Eremiobacterota bacterium]